MSIKLKLQLKIPGLAAKPEVGKILAREGFWLVV